MSRLTYKAIVLDSTMEELLEKKGAMLFRNNKHIIKLLLWHDMFSVQHDLYFIVEILEVLTERTDLPPIVHHLLLGLQDKLIDAADAKHYQELIHSITKHKVMYHKVLSMYFQNDSKWWRYYIWACSQWQVNVVSACTDLKYTKVPFETYMPVDDSFKHRPECNIRVKAMRRYLKFFGSEGKHYLKNIVNFEKAFDIKARLRTRRIKDKQRKEHLKRPQRPLSKMSRKELHNKKDGIEMRYNMHITMIADKEELLPEIEYIERLDQQAHGLDNATTYYPASSDQSDIVKKSAVEYFGRVFVDYRRYAQEHNVPFDFETGELLDPEDDVDAEIRGGDWSRKKWQLKPLHMDVENTVKKARHGFMKTKNSVVNDMFRGETATVRVPVVVLRERIASLEDETSTNDESMSLPVKRPEDPGKPKMPIRLLYDGDMVSNIAAHRIPGHSGAWKKEDPRTTEEIKKTQVWTTSRLVYQKLSDNGGTDSQFLEKPPEYLLNDTNSSILEFKDDNGHHRIQSIASGNKENDAEHLRDFIALIKKFGGGSGSEDEVIGEPADSTQNINVSFTTKNSTKNDICNGKGISSLDNKPEVTVLDLTGSTTETSDINAVKKKLKESDFDRVMLVNCNPSQKTFNTDTAQKAAEPEPITRSVSVNVVNNGEVKTTTTKEEITNTKTGFVVLRIEVVETKNDVVISKREKIVPITKNSKHKNVVVPELSSTLNPHTPETPGLTKCYVCMMKGQHQKCERCLVAHYCSRKCQALNWGEHKAMCRLIREEKLLAERGVGSALLVTEDDQMPDLC